MFTSTTVWSDVAGSQSFVTTNTGGGSAGIDAIAAGLSGAARVRSWQGVTTPFGGSASGVPYAQANQFAVLSFATAVGIVVYRVPAPNRSLFLADGTTVDPVVAAPLIAACIGALVDVAGNPALSYVGGVLQ